MKSQFPTPPKKVPSYSISTVNVSGGSGSIRGVQVRPPSKEVRTSIGAPRLGEPSTAPRLAAQMTQAVLSSGKARNGKPSPGGGFTSSHVCPPSCVTAKEVMSCRGALIPPAWPLSFQPCWLSLNHTSCDQPTPSKEVHVWPPSSVRHTWAGPQRDDTHATCPSSKKEIPLSSSASGLTSRQVLPPSVVRKMRVAPPSTSPSAQPVKVSNILIWVMVTARTGAGVPEGGAASSVGVALG